MRITPLLLLAHWMLGVVAHGQEFIPLTEADIARLGIVFAPLTQLDRQSGNRFPATVINSPESVSEVIAPFQGTVERWHVAPGQTVGAGQLLATLRSQQVLDLQNSWLGSLIEAEHAAFLLERDTQLFEQGIIARQRLQETEHEFEQAQIELNRLTGTLARAGFTEQTLQELADTPAQLGVYGLRAPSGGMLTSRSRVAGQPVEEYQSVATLGGAGQPWLRASVPARYAAELQAGKVLSVAGYPVTVTLRYRDLAVDESSQTVEVLAEFDSSVDFLPGQVLNLVVPPVDAGVLVPGSAVVHSGEDTVVFVRSQEGVEARVVPLEPAGGNYVAGAQLRVGDQVVIQGAAVLKGVQLGLGQDE